MELEPEPEPEPEPELFKSWNRNHIFSKVGTGSGTRTVKNSYGSTTLPKMSFVTSISGDVGDEAGDDRSHPGPRAAPRRRDIPEDGGGRQPRTRVVAARRRGGRRSHGTQLLAV